MGLTARMTLAFAAILIIVGTAAVWSLASGNGDSAPDGPLVASTSSTDDAIARLQTRVAQTPNAPDGYIELGGAYLVKARETGDPAWYTKAESSFNQALVLKDGHSPALVGLSTVAAARHDFEGALAFAEQAPPSDPDTQAVLGDALIELGRYDEAFAAYQSLSDMRPDLAAYTRVAYARELIGDREGALEAMQMAVDAAGPAGESAAWTRLQLGHLYFNGGDLDGAVQQYEQSLDVIPGYVHARAAIARVSAAQSDFDAAAAEYEAITAGQPVLEYVVALHEVYLAAGREADADRQLALVGAIKQLYEAEGFSSDLELALVEANFGDPSMAVEMARAAHARRPGIHAADALAWSLYKAGDYDGAATYIDEALRLGTQDALILFHAGMIADARADTAAARTYLGQAIGANPFFSITSAPVAESTLTRLESAVAQ